MYSTNFSCIWNLFILLSLIKILFLFVYSWFTMCVSFCCTTKWISYVYTHRLPLVPPSHPLKSVFLLLSQFFVSCPDLNSTVGCKNNVTVSKWAAFSPIKWTTIFCSKEPFLFQPLNLLVVLRCSNWNLSSSLRILSYECLKK